MTCGCSEGLMFGGGRGKAAAATVTKKELYERAKKLNIAGRSKMNKKELEKAVKSAKTVKSSKASKRR